MSGPSKKIFVVDDDVMLSAALEDYLSRKTDCQITVFETGEACLAKLEENPKVIVLDYFLNSISGDAANGLDILKAIKKKLPNTSVIMLSGQERYGVALQSIQKGAERYVLKSKDAFDEIVGIIKAID